MAILYSNIRSPMASSPLGLLAILKGMIIYGLVSAERPLSFPNVLMEEYHISI
jgi:hypothetical protein